MLDPALKLQVDPSEALDPALKLELQPSLVLQFERELVPETLVERQKRVEPAQRIEGTPVALGSTEKTAQRQKPS